MDLPDYVNEHVDEHCLDYLRNEDEALAQFYSDPDLTSSVPGDRNDDGHSRRQTRRIQRRIFVVDETDEEGEDEEMEGDEKDGDENEEEDQDMDSDSDTSPQPRQPQRVSRNQAPPPVGPPQTPATYVPYTFLLFYLDDKRRHVRPVMREWLFKYLNFISSTCRVLRPFEVTDSPGVLDAEPFNDRDYSWEKIQTAFPRLALEAARNHGPRVNLEYFLVWNHEGLLACRVAWNPSSVAAMTPAQRNGFRLGAESMRDIMMVPEVRRSCTLLANITNSPRWMRWII